MANKKYEETDIQAIADTIREKTGSEDSYKVSEIASGVNEVYEAGKKAEYDTFWGTYNLNNAAACSGAAWNKNTFKPNRDFNVGQYGFQYHNWWGNAYDLAEHLETLGVKIQKVHHTMPFGYAWLTRIPTIEFNADTMPIDRAFIECRYLVTIDKIILPEEKYIPSFNNPFGGCGQLKNITFEGIIPKSISFSGCPLTVESLKSIISCLKDYTGTTSEHTYTVTFKTSAFNALEAEGTTAEYNGEACTWAELIDNKKWNLTLA